MGSQIFYKKITMKPENSIAQLTSINPDIYPSKKISFAYNSLHNFKTSGVILETKNSSFENFNIIFTMILDNNYNFYISNFEKLYINFIKINGNSVLDLQNKLQIKNNDNLIEKREDEILEYKFEIIESEHSKENSNE